MSEEKQEKVELHVLHTPCAKCVFAEYGQSGTCMTQGGCSAGRLDKYREQGTDIVEAYGEDGDEFYIVNGRSCPFFRDRRSEWAKAVPPEQRLATARRELTVRTDIVIPLEWKDQPEWTEAEKQALLADRLLQLGATLNSLKALHLKPSSVVVLSNQSTVRVGNLIAKLNKLANGLNWRLVDIRERRADGSRVDAGRMLDMEAGKFKGHFYTVVFPGQTLPPTFTLDLDRAVVDDMARFVVLLPNKDLVGWTVSLGFHNAPMVNGNKAVAAPAFDEDPDAPTGDPVLLTGVTEKAQYLAKARKSPHLVARVEDVCPSLA